MKWLILSALILTGCTEATTAVRPIVIDSKPIERTELVLPNVDRYKARDVNWTIITPENAEEIFAELERQGKPLVLFGLTKDGYEGLSINTKEALRIILQQQAVIDGYRAYYVRTDDKIATHNSNQ